MKKRIISIILAALMMVAPMATFAQETVARKTTPVPEHVAQLLEAIGVMNATEANTERDVQRGYVAQILLNLSKIDEGSATGAYYTDVNNSTPYGYAIEKMKHNYGGVGRKQPISELSAFHTQFYEIVNECFHSQIVSDT